VRKGERFTFRVTAAEKRLIERAAKLAQRSASDWTRLLALETARQQIESAKQRGQEKE